MNFSGVITFISKGYGGRASDTYITNDCGVLENLLPGDVVLADRGFSIAEDVGFFAAKVVIPAKTRGKMQLTPFEIEETRRLAHLRIHVERVIGVNNWKFYCVTPIYQTSFHAVINNVIIFFRSSATEIHNFKQPDPADLSNIRRPSRANKR